MGKIHKVESDSERSAREIVERHLGISFKFMDQNGEVDFVSFENGFPKIALEVTSSTDKSKTQLANSIDEDRNWIESTQVQKNWLVNIQGVPKYSQIQGEIIQRLAEIELHEIDRINMSSQSWWLKGVPSLLGAISFFERAGVQSVSSQIGIFRNQDISKNRIIVITASENWIYSGIDAALTYFEQFASSDFKDRRKLNDSGCKSRHLFIWVDENNLKSTRELFNPEQNEIPTTIINLEPEITDLWIADKVTKRIFYFDAHKNWTVLSF